ncbi:hypothetical protein J6590_048530 [Homalodisca vitripennis]|nr:hypothetical protein J6590_048530 [Homalodisca vitripennis]
MIAPTLKPLRGSDVVSVSADCKTPPALADYGTLEPVVSRCLCEFLLFRCQDPTWLSYHLGNQRESTWTTSTATAKGEEKRRREVRKPLTTAEAATTSTTGILHDRSIAVNNRNMNLRVLFGVSDNFGYVEPELRA